MYPALVSVSEVNSPTHAILHVRLDDLTDLQGVADYLMAYVEYITFNTVRPQEGQRPAAILRAQAHCRNLLYHIEAVHGSPLGISTLAVAEGFEIRREGLKAVVTFTRSDPMRPTRRITVLSRTMCSTGLLHSWARQQLRRGLAVATLKGSSWALDMHRRKAITLPLYLLDIE